MEYQAMVTQQMHGTRTMIKPALTIAKPLNTYGGAIVHTAAYVKVVQVMLDLRQSGSF